MLEQHSCLKHSTNNPIPTPKANPTNNNDVEAPNPGCKPKLD